MFSGGGTTITPSPSAINPQKMNLLRARSKTLLNVKPHALKTVHSMLEVKATPNMFEEDGEEDESKDKSTRRDNAASENENKDEKTSSMQSVKDAINKQQREEIHRMKLQMDELSSQNVMNKEKLEKMAQIEKAVLHLYIEMKEKPDMGAMLNDEAREEYIEAERRRLSKTDVMVLLDYMRTELRELITVRNDWDFEIKAEIERKKIDLELQNEELRKKITELGDKIKIQNVQINEVHNQMTEAMQARDKVVSEYNELIDKHAKEKQEWVEQLEKRSTEIQNKDSSIKQLQVVIQSKDLKLRRLGELEQKIQGLRGSHEVQKSQIQLEHEKAMSKVLREKESLEERLEKRLQLEQELKQAQDTIAEFRRNGIYAELENTQVKLNRVTKQLETTNASLLEAQSMYRRTQYNLEAAQKQINKLSKENSKYRGLYESKKDAKLRETRESDDGTDGKSTGEAKFRITLNENKPTVEAYKELVREREKEIMVLQKRVKELSRMAYDMHHPAPDYSTLPNPDLQLHEVAPSYPTFAHRIKPAEQSKGEVTYVNKKAEPRSKSVNSVRQSPVIPMKKNFSTTHEWAHTLLNLEGEVTTSEDESNNSTTDVSGRESFADNINVKAKPRLSDEMIRVSTTIVAPNNITPRSKVKLVSLPNSPN
eukprot:TRINITY_DN15099_c0_g1_i1.p1 TRINITY_DN15099_c0_g1~~TRINITY_DN15099_c0_g1_i1.p1  ORF type:complete len:654 (-),score=155.01 TRINITY_DN15099_c0_g1_i1:197-2158(-)